jgi:hypothetical protein
MIIRFTKGNGHPDTLTCIRDDGTRTWSAVGSGVGVRHDLTHYAVETTLGYTEAFYGLVASGRDIQSFGTRDGRKDSYPRQAIWAEHIVGMFQYPGVSGHPMTYDDLVEQLRIAFSSAEESVPDVTREQHQAICATLELLLDRWSAVSPGESLDLDFRYPDDAHDSGRD